MFKLNHESGVRPSDRSLPCLTLILVLWSRGLPDSIWLVLISSLWLLFSKDSNLFLMIRSAVVNKRSEARLVPEQLAPRSSSHVTSRKRRMMPQKIRIKGVIVRRRRSHKVEQSGPENKIMITGLVIVKPCNGLHYWSCEINLDPPSRRLDQL